MYCAKRSVPVLCERRQGWTNTGGAVVALAVLLLLAAPIAPPGAPHALPPSARARSSTGPITNGTNWYPGHVLGWSEATPAPLATGEGAGFAADASLGLAVLFGGQSGTSLSGATGEYDESTSSWSNVTGVSPSPRSYFAFAGSSTDHVAVLFGGVTNAVTGATTSSTWVFNFSTGSWTNVTGGAAPAARADAAFAIDPAGGYGLLFGGWDTDYNATGTLTYRDLWKFDLSTDRWSPLVPSGPSAPPALEGASLAWDSREGLFDLFGGCFPCTSGVWTYDPVANRWTPPNSVSSVVPAPRSEAAWAYDPTAGRDLLFGGTDGEVAFNDTYLYDPSNRTWTAENVTISPSARYGTANAWLGTPGNETLLLSGGHAFGPPARTLWRLAATTNLTVSVTNATSGLPLPSALVSVDGQTLYRTGPTGGLTLVEQPSNETTLSVSDLGYATASSAFWPAPGSSAALSYRLSPVAPFNLSVRVLSVADLPLANARVNLTIGRESISEGGAIFTNAAGFANYTGLLTESPPPLGNVTAAATDYFASTNTLTFPAGSSLAISFFLSPFPVLRLRVEGVLSPTTLTALRNATVYQNGAVLGATGPAGYLNVSTSQVGRSEFLVTADGYAPDAVELVVPSSGTFTHVFVLNPRPFGLLDVYVFSHGNRSRGIGGAIVTLSASASNPLTNWTEDGTANAFGWANLSVPAENYTVGARAYGYFPNNTSRPVYVPSNRTSMLFLNLTLEPGAQVGVRVFDASTHRVIAGATVTIGDLPERFTNDSGWANFTNVPFGPQTLTARDAGYYPNSTTASFHPFEVVPEIDLNLTPVPTSLTLLPGGGLGGIVPELRAAWPLVLLPLLVLVAAALFWLGLRASVRAEPSRGLAPSGRPGPRTEPGERGGFLR